MELRCLTAFTRSAEKVRGARSLETRRPPRNTCGSRRLLLLESRGITGLIPPMRSSLFANRALAVTVILLYASSTLRSES
ncbi:hypothetical protein D3C73_1456620 [compost metagenome]